MSANNTIDYSISQTANANSIITVNENGSDIAVVTIKNGENGGSGTAQLGDPEQSEGERITGMLDNFAKALGKF